MLILPKITLDKFQDFMVKSARPNENHSHLAFCGLVDFDDDKKLDHYHQNWANGSDNFHLHFKADQFRLVFW